MFLGGNVLPSQPTVAAVLEKQLRRQENEGITQRFSGIIQKMIVRSWYYYWNCEDRNHTFPEKHGGQLTFYWVIPELKGGNFASRKSNKKKNPHTKY